jgi:hypothetical protein
MLIALGIIDHESGRAASHIAKILSTLSRQNYGVARYPGDAFYFTGPWSPGGNEALAAEPSWPQMSLWIAVYESLSGGSAAALARLQWYVSVCGKRYLPPGETVSNVTLQPLLSSMCEPLTAASFILAALVYERQYSLTVIPPVYNAGAFKSIDVKFGTSDGAQWTNVPYFLGAGSRIKRVYIANDDSNIYLRLDNTSGTFPEYQREPYFAFQVYSQDFSNGNSQSSNLGIDGQPLKRPMNYMVERRSESEEYYRRHVSGEFWVGDGTVQGVIAPRWNPASGRIEAVIPISALSSGNSPLGNAWANVLVVLAAYDSAGNAWREADSMILHYRLSSPDQNWIYGNIER